MTAIMAAIVPKVQNRLLIADVLFYTALGAFYGARTVAPASAQAIGGLVGLVGGAAQGVLMRKI